MKRLKYFPIAVERLYEGAGRAHENWLPNSSQKSGSGDYEKL